MFGLNLLIGIIGSAKTFSIGFAFLPNESIESYTFAFEEFKKLGIRPPIMAMDGLDGLKSAANKVYTDIPRLLCTWHVNKNVLSKYKGKFRTKEVWEAFYSTWRDLIQSLTFKYLMNVGKNSKAAMIIVGLRGSYDKQSLLRPEPRLDVTSILLVI